LRHRRHASRRHRLHTSRTYAQKQIQPQRVSRLLAVRIGGRAPHSRAATESRRSTRRSGCVVEEERTTLWLGAGSYAMYLPISYTVMEYRVHVSRVTALDDLDLRIWLEAVRSAALDRLAIRTATTRTSGQCRRCTNAYLDALLTGRPPDENDRSAAAATRRRTQDDAARSWRSLIQQFIGALRTMLHHRPARPGGRARTLPGRCDRPGPIRRRPPSRSPTRRWTSAAHRALRTCSDRSQEHLRTSGHARCMPPA